METLKLKVRSRSETGKSYTRKARQQGWVPAIYYGHGIDSRPIEVDAFELMKLDRKHHLTHLIDLGLEGDGKSIAIVKEVQRDVVKTDLIKHVDFQHVEMGEKVTVTVPVAVQGEPVGVTEEEGVFSHPMHEVTIECMPAEIPENIPVDVSGLHVNESIHVKDISIPGIEIKNSPDEVVASVNIVREEPEPVAEEAVEGEEGAEGAAEGEEAAEGQAGAEKGDGSEGEEKNEEK